MTTLMRCLLVAMMMLSLGLVGGCLKQTCTKACEHADDCAGGWLDADECTETCINDHQDKSAACKAAHSTWVNCQVAEGCSALCVDEWQEYSDECG